MNMTYKQLSLKLFDMQPQFLPIKREDIHFKCGLSHSIFGSTSLVFYFEITKRKSLSELVILSLFKYGESGRCRLETLGIQSPIKKIRSDIFILNDIAQLNMTDRYILAAVLVR